MGRNKVNCFFYLLIFCLIYFSIANPSTNRRMHHYVSSKTKSLIDITEHDLEEAIRVAEDHIQKLATFERNIIKSGLRTEHESPTYGQMIDFTATEEAINNTKSAFVVIKATQYLASKFCSRSQSKRKQCLSQLSTRNLPESSQAALCTNVKSIHCSSQSLYRSADGSCNNEHVPNWGKSNTAYRRLLEADYEDSIYTLRSSSASGKELPSARLVSTTVADTKDVADEHRTQAVAIWGLFIGHDLSHAPASNMVNIKTPITCCTSDGRPLSPRYHHTSCAAIHIPHTDLFYKQHFQSCMNYVRTLPSVRPDCTFGPTEQMNQASHFLDGSMIYGSTAKKMNSLRAMWGGRLLTSLERNREEYPPVTDFTGRRCHITNLSYCYDTGDNRLNSQPQLTALHILFLREHNRIADGLAVINEHWNDEKLFQESRKIVIAEIQHITYNYWLPSVLGKSLVKKIGLDSSHSSHNHLYNEHLEPTISNSFATAALPAFYSMIDGNIGLYKEDRNSTESAELKNHFVRLNTPQKKDDFFDKVVRGLATQKSLKIDSNFAEAITQFWYTFAGDYGMDLLSLDIQKGRDHGLPSYVFYRKHFNLSEVSSFKDLKGVISTDVISRLENAYKKAADIDLLVGAVSELATNDAVFGLTLQAIFAEQFYRTRYGDRYFYDNPAPYASFSKAQLVQIKRSNLARIFCDNSNKIKRMQKDVFSVPREDLNELLSCQETSFPFIDLNAWKEFVNITE